MTAFLSFKYADCIQLLTDGAAYDESAIMHRVMEKSWRSSRVPLAVTGRGNVAAVEHMARQVTAFSEEAGSFDEAIEFVRSALRELGGLSVFQTDDGPHFELVVAGFSETTGFEVFFSVTSRLSGVEPFLLHRQGAFLVGAPDLDAPEVQMLTDQTPMSDPLFLERHGVEIMELMRRKMATKVNMFRPGAQSGSVVGGMCNLTTITEGGTVFKTLKEWNDPVGEPINPYSHVPEVVLLSRKERRRLKAITKTNDGHGDQRRTVA